MNSKMLKITVPLRLVKLVCIAAMLVGIVFLASGSWISGLCMMLGSYILEKSAYRCPGCGRSLDMKRPLMKGGKCPFCKAELRK